MYTCIAGMIARYVITPAADRMSFESQRQNEETIAEKAASESLRAARLWRVRHMLCMGLMVDSRATVLAAPPAIPVVSYLARMRWLGP